VVHLDLEEKCRRCALESVVYARMRPLVDAFGRNVFGMCRINGARLPTNNKTWSY
jgi:hypothetical protein